MKNTIKTILSFVVVTAAASAFAKTDVAAKVDQLKINADNSKVNLTQYEDNLKTVDQNLADINKAQKDIANQKKALAKQYADAQKGKDAVDSVRKQIEAYRKAEQTKLEIEQKQIAALEAALGQLKANASKRSENIAAYDQKLQENNAQVGSYQERNQSIVELANAIRAKEAQAAADKKDWSDKKANYESEVDKWKKEVRVSERDLANFKGLKED